MRECIGLYTQIVKIRIHNKCLVDDLYNIN